MRKTKNSNIQNFIELRERSWEKKEDDQAKEIKKNKKK
jgi:hypothetical protein